VEPGLVEFSLVIIEYFTYFITLLALSASVNNLSYYSLFSSKLYSDENSETFISESRETIFLSPIWILCVKSVSCGYLGLFDSLEGV